jgi:hypothetical protein
VRKEHILSFARQSIQAKPEAFRDNLARTFHTPADSRDAARVTPRFSGAVSAGTRHFQTASAVFAGVYKPLKRFMTRQPRDHPAKAGC